jgi:hypothetical protein
MPTLSNYVCVPCGVFMLIDKNSVTVEELMSDGQPYKLWDGDRYKCPTCGHTIISGFGKLPMAEHFQPSYAAQRARLEPVVTAK